MTQKNPTARVALGQASKVTLGDTVGEIERFGLKLAGASRSGR